MNNIVFDQKSADLIEKGSREGLLRVEETGGEATPVLAQYFRIALRWKWLILGSVIACLVAGMVATLLMTPLYTATTRIEITRESSKIVEVDGLEPKNSAVDMEFYQTQYGLLRSRELAEQVVRDLRLHENQQFYDTFGLSPDEMDLPGGRRSAAGRDMLIRKSAEALLSHLDISPVRGSRLVDINFTSPSPSLSAQISDAWAANFIESTLTRRYEATSYARRFLEDRLSQLRQRLDESERQLVAYASSQSIINIPVQGVNGEGSSIERPLIADNLATLNGALATATAERVRAESRWRQAGSDGAVPEALQNDAITTLRQRRGEAAAEYSRLMEQFEPSYPPARALQAQVQELDSAIRREERRVQASLQNAYRESVSREQALAARVEGLKSGMLDLRRRSIQYNILQREVDTNRELYNGLLQRYKEIGVAGGVGTNNVSIVDPAEIPEAPSRPRPLINLLISLLAGLVIGIGLALAREQIDERITDPAELERMLELPLLGAAPKSKGEDPFVELRDPRSSLIEAYLAIQTNLSFSTDHGVPKTISVTSTRPAEGKSTTSFAIAHTVAKANPRTILIDGDMRSPSVHQYLGLENGKGLSNYLSGTSSVDELVQHPESEPFAVLTAGPQPPNAAELLRGEKLRELLEELLKRFDHIIIDSPPVMGLADAPLIASRVEGTVFVVESHGIKARLAKIALGRLRQGRARIIGTVLTKFETKRAHFGYGYDYGYGYGDTQKAA